MTASGSRLRIVVTGLAALHPVGGITRHDRHVTYAENIAYGSPAATHTQIQDAARAADAHDFISTVPEDYETGVGERGMTMSDGQRQRIALAHCDRVYAVESGRLLQADPATAEPVLDNIGLAKEAPQLG